MELIFQATGQGSNAGGHVISFEGFQILLDAGVASSSGDSEAPLFDGAGCHSILLTHPNPARCGLLPYLVEEGFRGTIFATSATQDLAANALRQAVAETGDAGRAEAPPCLYQMHGVPPGREFHALRNLIGTFHETSAGLGAATVEVHAPRHRLLYVGALTGNRLPGLPVHQPPIEVHTLILDAQGSSGQPPPDRMESLERLVQLIDRARSEKGKIVVPAASTGHGLGLLAALQTLRAEERLPEEFEAAVAGPLALNPGEVLRHHGGGSTPEERQRLIEEDDPFGYGAVVLVRTPARLKQWLSNQVPGIVLAGQDGQSVGTGALLVSKLGADPRHALLCLTPPPPGSSLDRALTAGENWAGPASLETALGLDPGIEERLTLVRRINEGGALRQVFVVHGTPVDRDVLSEALKEETSLAVHLPEPGQSFAL